MFNITLFCTTHGVAGNCNVSELYKIIVQLEPEVIFEELPPCLFDEYYKDMTKDNLEVNTIKLYLSNHDIKHIPVDLDAIMSQSFWDEIKYMVEQIERKNSKFCRLCDADSQYTRRYGFNYLNSIYCSNINKDKYEEMETTLKMLNNKKLSEIYETWNNIHEKRENEMIINIYNYCKENIFDRGLFFIGAAHRESIIAKIKKYNENETELLNIKWNYLDYDNYNAQLIDL
jgi:hypothetical protein